LTIRDKIILVRKGGPVYGENKNKAVPVVHKLEGGRPAPPIGGVPLFRTGEKKNKLFTNVKPEEKNLIRREKRKSIKAGKGDITARNCKVPNGVKS